MVARLKLKGIDGKAHQVWILRLNSTQHGETHEGKMWRGLTSATTVAASYVAPSYMKDPDSDIVVSSDDISNASSDVINKPILSPENKTLSTSTDSTGLKIKFTLK